MILSHCVTVICSSWFLLIKQKSLFLTDEVVLTRTCVHLLGLGSDWILATSLIALSSMCEVRQVSQGGSALTHCTFITRKPMTAVTLESWYVTRNPSNREGQRLEGKRASDQSSYSASGDHMTSRSVSRHSCGSDSHHVIAQPSSRCTFLSCTCSGQDFLDKEINWILQQLQSPLRFSPLWIIGCYWMSPCCVMTVVLHVSFRTIRGRNLVTISPLQRETEAEGV